MRFLCGIYLCLLALSAAPCAAKEPSGIIVDEIAPGSEIERAGLRAGDVLRSWDRLPSPPANPEPAQGSFASPFDWMWLEVEQAYRGPVDLRGERDGKPRTWHVAMGEWNVHFNQERRGRSRTRPILGAEEVALYERGQLQIRRRNPTEGLTIWRGLVERISPQLDDPVRCWLFLRIGEVWGELGNWQRAHEAFEEATTYAQNDRTKVFLIEALGKSFEYQGRFREAEEVFQTGLAIRRATEPNSLGVARSLHQIASDELNLGNLDRAKEGFDQVLALRSRWAPGSFLEADSLQTQGMMAGERSDFESAEQYLKRSVAIQERIDPNSFWMAFKLGSLADAYLARGDLDLAAYYFEKVLEIRQRLVPGGESVATALARLGRIQLNLGKWKEARVLFEKSLTILNRVFPRHPMVATVLNDLGDTALAAGDLDHAEDAYRRALHHFAEISPERAWAGQSWNGLAEVAVRRKQWKTAAACFQKALVIYRRVAPGTDGEAGTLAGLGRIAWRIGDLGLASTRFHEAIRALEAQVGRLGGSEDVKSEFRSLRRRVYFDASAIELELNRTEEAFNIQEAARAQGFLSLLAARDLNVSDGIPAELEEERRRVGRRFRQALSSVNEIPNTQENEPAVEAWRDIPILRDQLDTIAQQIRKLSPRSTNLHFPQPLRVGDVARELDPGMKVLAYQVGETSTQVFVLSEEGHVRALTLPLGRGDLQREIGRFRAALEAPLFEGDFAVLGSLRRLYRAVLQPVEPLLEGAGRLLILPDGPLHALPWAALVRDSAAPAPPSGRSWQFFVEWKPFTVAISATVWAELKSSRGRLSPQRAEDRNTPVRSIAAFGDPVRPPRIVDPGRFSLAEAQLAGSIRRGLDPSPLPFSRREVEGIAQLFPEQLIAYVGKEAKEEYAKNLPKGTRIVHFATHGFADERLPMNSGLLLTPPENPDESAEDGFLQAWEIFERVRLDADLVVLSACDTARGKELGGEGLLSLTRAFQFAGARAVVASLWQVADQGSADLMVRFYSHLKSGAAPADALRAAQLEIIAKIPWPHGEPKAKDLVWAAFEVFGDWR